VTRIAIVTDAWHPQINGVVSTLENTAKALRALGHEVEIVAPDLSRFSIPLPTYPDIRLELFAASRIEKFLCEFTPDSIHIATEGSLGRAARKICMKCGLAFTTAYHTRFPEYVENRAPRLLAPAARALALRYVRSFHKPSACVLVPTESIADDLCTKGFKNIVIWPRGVDTYLFTPNKANVSVYGTLPRPILLYVGRVAVEKNLPAFLDMDIAGSKVVIGDGPDLKILRDKYPEAIFLGPKANKDIAPYYSAADLFVFPSTTETLGLVLLEAAASGLRIAACPAPGPLDLFSSAEAKQFSCLDENLQKAVEQALKLPPSPEAARRFAEKFSWEESARSFAALTNVEALHTKE
jgi:glycosyltransferase involved in cell wall biosynthesis